MEPEAAVTSGPTTGSNQSEQNVAGQDYSNLPSAPTAIGIEDNGTILISGTVTGKIGGGGADDIDYVTFTIPEGRKASSFELKDYQSADKIAFAALQAGPQITGSAKDPKAFLGYTHFGTGASQGNIGDNLLTKLNQAKPLTAGTYSLWIQQGGPIPMGADAARATTRYAFQLKTDLATTSSPPAEDTKQDPQPSSSGESHETRDSNGSDYSNHPLAPTLVEPSADGIIEISGKVTGKIGGGGPDDVDYVTFKVPTGSQLTSFSLESYTSVDKIAFIALQSGPKITGSAKDVKALLGYSHFGSGADKARVGDNLLGKLNKGKPLNSGTYSLWIQQGGPIPLGADAARAATSYRFKLRTEKKNEPTASEETMVSDQTAELPNNRTDLILSGAKRINGTGNHKNNRITGNDSDNILDGREGADVLTGKAGKDQFSYIRLKNSTLNSHDRITDFVIGVDQIKGPRPVPASAVIELESITSFNAQSTSNLLTSKLFRPHQAASFSFNSDAGKRVFLAINNDLAGYQASQDCLIEITGFTGRLGDLSIS